MSLKELSCLIRRGNSLALKGSCVVIGQLLEMFTGADKEKDGKVMRAGKPRETF